MSKQDESQMERAMDAERDRQHNEQARRLILPPDRSVLLEQLQAFYEKWHREAGCYVSGAMMASPVGEMNRASADVVRKMLRDLDALLVAREAPTTEKDLSRVGEETAIPPERATAAVNETKDATVTRDELRWFASHFRSVFDGFLWESQNGVVCSIPDEGLNEAPHRTWCERCQQRWIKFKHLIDMLDRAAASPVPVAPDHAQCESDKTWLRAQRDVAEEKIAEARKEGLQHLASAMRKLLPPALMKEVLGYLAPHQAFIEAMRDAPAVAPDQGREQVCKRCGALESFHCDLDEPGVDHPSDCPKMHHEFKGAASPGVSTPAEPEQLIQQRAIGHAEGQRDTIADVNAGRIDDLIQPRLQQGSATPAEQERYLIRANEEIAKREQAQIYASRCEAATARMALKVSELEAQLAAQGSATPAEQERELKDYLREIAVNLGLPPEVLDMCPCRHIAHHAKAIYEALLETQRELEKSRKAGSATPAVIAEIVEEIRRYATICAVHSQDVKHDAPDESADYQEHSQRCTMWADRLASLPPHGGRG